MKVAISGSSGLLGTYISKKFIERGDSVTRIVRPFSKFSKDESVILFDPLSGLINKEALEEFDLIINLAGENIAGSRWSRSVKRKIFSSRIDSTELLSKTVANLKSPPKLFVSASATGFYGSRDSDEEVNEQSTPGKGFRADLCRAWEEATMKVHERGIRVVHARIGIVISKDGGTLKRMLPIFKIGLGGKLGNGKQIISWIAIEDVFGIIEHIIKNESIEGPVNFVSPNPLTNEAFTNMLASVLKRPAIFKVPSFVLRLRFGQMADELLLSSLRVNPKKLIESGYSFNYPTLEKLLLNLF